eukprot:CAMPEP_0116952722 /NCGR_PEP_ID=MMETSP0467-20121206/40913_1 /TAXON_ID=283647 /ORGANISM="Mesodinium pulex, Strain SPMC105" /LENGTH=71 /DNA_ID=CAMNT_0004638071 /DNA_START=1291 /DNA_END=1503 /DNA_ORIENTATION=+
MANKDFVSSLGLDKYANNQYHLGNSSIQSNQKEGNDSDSKNNGNNGNNANNANNANNGNGEGNRTQTSTEI